MPTLSTPRTATVTTPSTLRSVLNASDTFVHRHIGPSESEIAEMLKMLGYSDLESFSDAVVPEAIRVRRALRLEGLGSAEAGEHETMFRLKRMAGENKVFRSYIGMGYHDCIVPAVVQRNILENPGWYTQYTPYQAEIAQGRLEALLNFQTMISDLTGLPLAGASLLDEGTAAAEAMAMCFGIAGQTRRTFYVASDCHPQTISVVQTRADGLDIKVVVSDVAAFDYKNSDLCGVLVQYPTTDGRVENYQSVADQTHAAGAYVVVAADLLSLALLKPPGEFGADVCIGNSQRFGVPMGFGGPHAAFIATKAEHARKVPGRIIGVSRDSQGNPALRMAIQTREQHIRREKATSNICTAQALLAIMASMYAVYHGPEGIRQIAQRVYSFTAALAAGLKKLGHTVQTPVFFDTLRIKPASSSAAVMQAALKLGINLRDFGDGTVGVALDETTRREDIADLLAAFGGNGSDTADSLLVGNVEVPAPFARQSKYLTHPVFNTHHSETEMLRYIFKLMNRDLSLAQSMIPLGSCTMKLNATTEMLPVTWPEFGKLHPFVPQDQSRGYQLLFKDLENWLSEITGFAAVSLQPNAGSQGEYAGLMVIRAYHQSRGDTHRDVCLIPNSAHGTNPASAVIAGMKVVAVLCDSSGNVDVADLKLKAAANKDKLAALMVTYPSTHGVFETSIKEICQIVHDHGGQVYMDGANMNAQVGLTSPGSIGADVCHLNLHKTFCIPHGGGGPGMGPIGVAKHLAAFLPSHPVSKPAGATNQSIGPISAATYGSPSILTISWVYIAMMGAAGLKKATQVAMLSANYMSKRLEGHFDVLFKGQNGRCAHEFILDCRGFDKAAHITVDDIAKRLMDYGFHAPTMSFPVAGTLMIEPTESEPKAELDRFCDTLIAIRNEIADIAAGKLPQDNNMLKNAPHTIAMVSANEWNHPYPRERAAFPTKWLHDSKFWPCVGRVDNPYGDRNLICTCPSVTEVAE